MAKKKQEEVPETSEGVLVTAAKSLGLAAGKIASAVGISAPAAPKPKVPKLAKKNKSRLPRKMKKALRRKASQAQG